MVIGNGYTLFMMIFHSVIECNLHFEKKNCQNIILLFYVALRCKIQCKQLAHTQDICSSYFRRLIFYATRADIKTEPIELI